MTQHHDKDYSYYYDDDTYVSRRRAVSPPSHRNRVVDALEHGDLKGAVDVFRDPPARPRARRHSSDYYHSNDYSRRGDVVPHQPRHHNQSYQRYSPNGAGDSDLDRRGPPLAYRSYDNDEDDDWALERRGRSRTSARGVGGGGASRSRSQWAHAAEAALAAGAVEAWRTRNAQDKGARIATAAVGAGVIDAFMDGRHGGRHPSRHGKRHVVEAAVGGLLVNRLANGGRKEARR